MITSRECSSVRKVRLCFMRMKSFSFQFYFPDSPLLSLIVCTVYCNTPDLMDSKTHVDNILRVDNFSAYVP